MKLIGKQDEKLKTLSSFSLGAKKYSFYSIKLAEKALGINLGMLPHTLKILLENLLRHYDGKTVRLKDIKSIASWVKNKKGGQEIAFSPSRVLMQDFTGVPAVVDLAAMRDAMASAGGDPDKINPLSPVDLVIDHSVTVDRFGDQKSFKQNVDLEYKRNIERYEFLKWGQAASRNFRVVPPGTGICHQVNLEYLAKVVWTRKTKNENLVYPDTLVGTDSHTTMINALSVLGWGVGGIEAEAAMLGQPISMLVPEVIGFKLSGSLSEGTTATDLVLTVTEILRKRGVVGKFVEFFGPGLSQLSLADRATISNMAPEYGATCGFFSVDQETLNYLASTGRTKSQIDLVEKYSKLQGIWRSSRSKDPLYTEVIGLDISKVESSLAGPKRPQDRVFLSQAPSSFKDSFKDSVKSSEQRATKSNIKKIKLNNKKFTINHGDILIAAITSCTNTSNPAVMIGSGILARNAVAKGLVVKPWVKTSLAPGSKVVTEYLKKAEVQNSLNKLGFNLVGYGCTTCIGNSGPLSNSISEYVQENKIITASVLSGNRNFEGRISPITRANYLASPILVVAYALAGNITFDFSNDILGNDKKGNPVYLKDIWPSNKEINNLIGKSLKPKMFRDQYAGVFEGDSRWKKIKTGSSKTYKWNKNSTYVKNPPYFLNMSSNLPQEKNILGARILALLGDSITTDHISPAGSIKTDSPAGKYLIKNKVNINDFNSYGARRGNHEVMMRGTFGNIRLQNEMLPGTEGGLTICHLNGKQMSIYDAAMKYQSKGTSLIIVSGKEYGTGSSRDWAAKGTSLLGVKAVIAESFERIHRSNLVGMGVLPLEFEYKNSRRSLNLVGDEIFDITGLEKKIKPKMKVRCSIKYQNGQSKAIDLLCRIDTENEVSYYLSGGILHYVLKNMMIN